MTIRAARSVLTSDRFAKAIHISCGMNGVGVWSGHSQRVQSIIRHRYGIEAPMRVEAKARLCPIETNARHVPVSCGSHITAESGEPG